MGKSLTPEQEKELELKLEAFEGYVEASIEMNIESDQESINNGEYKYLVEDSNISESPNLSEDLQEALDNSTVSVDDLISKALDEDKFTMEYEELSSPFQYGGQVENEFHCLQWGGDRDCQIDRDNISVHLPSFPLAETFDNYAEFEEYVNYKIGRQEYLKKYWEFATTALTHTQVTYNTDYDVVRCVLSDEESLIAYLKENVKPEEPFTKKTLKVTKEEFRDLRNNHDGFCVYCGKINDGGHEPDAQNYECSHCEKKHSSGVEILFMSGEITIVDNDDESTLPVQR